MRHLILSLIAVAALTLTACETTSKTDDHAGHHAAVDKAGYVTAEHKGQLYVAKKGTDAAEQLKKDGHFAKPITAIGARVNGMKVMAPDEATLHAYLGW